MADSGYQPVGIYAQHGGGIAPSVFLR